jgi:predicted enzyme involved in methoxymalonyl-ACP biosynthesis
MVFDSIIMSCRAMGFGFETVLLRGPLDASPGAATAVGRYVPSSRNRPCASVFQDAGFVRDGDGLWRLDLSMGRPDIPDWLAITER